ncbi:MAG: ATP-dependent Clp protease ATP-binding subunit, partial [Ruthenibacterium sp.]
NKAMKALQDFLRPEFLSRVDEVIMFNPLSDESLHKIAALMLGEYVTPLAGKGVKLTWTDAALELLCKKAAGGKFGARDLRRVIRKEVEDRLAARIIDGSATATLCIDAKNDEIALNA